jgi:putative ABC transport system permease protein
VRLFTILSHFVQDVRAQKLRTALTVLGITWGTVAVVVLLAFGSGLERQNKKNMHGMGDGIVVLFGGRTTLPFEGFPDGRSINLRGEDVDVLSREIADIAQISPEYRHSGVPVRRGTAVTTPTLTGIDPVYGDMRNVIPEPGGRFINARDVAGRRRVVMLGDEIKRLLFGDEEAVGDMVYVGETPFTVIGVMQPKTQNSSYYSRDQDRVFMPSSTFQSVFGHTYLSNVVYRPTDATRTEAVRQQVYETVGRKYRFDPSDSDALGVWDTNEADEFMSYFFLGFNLFMGIIGCFTMTVGGIGVANIMYVVVRERTREIGIKRSVGARRRDVLFQFFLEAFLIVAIGAAFGMLISIALVQALAYLPDGAREVIGTPTLSPVVLITTMSLLAAMAFLAGFFPARRASRLDPVECLRS